MQSLGVFSPHNPTDDAALMTAVHGAFHGVTMSAAALEALIAAHVRRKYIKDVADTYAVKWWDYRRMAPGHAFSLFVFHYYRAFKMSARKMLNERARDRSRAALVGMGRVQFTADDIWQRDNPHIVGMWKAMLTADSLGIPYDHFCQIGFRIATERLWKRLPSPQQLYSIDLAAMVLDEWVALSKDRLIVARHPMFEAVNYAGLKVQDDYRSWVIDTLKSTNSDIVNALAVVCMDRKQLTLDQARNHFPDYSVRRAELLRC